MESLPPGQVWGRRWIIYAALGVPEVDIKSWKLVIEGNVKRVAEYSYDELLSLEHVQYKTPFHCVTNWSIKDVTWEGVSIRKIVEPAEVLEDSRWVMFHCLDGYTAPVPVEDAMHQDSIIALKINGLPLSRQQGFPARPFIPHLYGWKSAKWLHRIEFMKDYRDGYWEMYGYHERGNVWEEERFKGDEGRHRRRTSIGTMW
jgi:DMSO/TMAO reductase YedYZ molybdopterin-dependent catalytic subunit